MDRNFVIKTAERFACNIIRLDEEIMEGSSPNLKKMLRFKSLSKKFKNYEKQAKTREYNYSFNDNVISDNYLLEIMHEIATNNYLNQTDRFRSLV